jgi:hypothetical protein
MFAHTFSGFESSRTALISMVGKLGVSEGLMDGIGSDGSDGSDGQGCEVFGGDRGGTLLPRNCIVQSTASVSGCDR